MTVPGTNAGTGHRLNPRCSKCAKGGWSSDLSSHVNRRGYRLTVLGPRRKRQQASHNNASRRVDTLYQYKIRCDECGHEGWTRHADIKRRWEVQHG